jgi:DNA-binding beta-propeller fold protein YncE
MRKAVTMRTRQNQVGIIDVLAARGGLFVPFMLALAMSCMHNRPDPPDVPVGPSSVEVDSAYTFNASASSGRKYEQHGLVWVRFEWGDGDTSPWCGHGETVECSHSWRHGGTYAVRAQARDDRAELSEWSEPLKVTSVVPAYPYRLVDSVTVGGALFDAQVLPNGEFVYVTDMWGESLSVVRTSDMQVVRQISLNQGWWGEGEVQVMCSPNSDFAYVVPYSYDCVGVIRTSDHVVVDSMKLEGDALCSAISPDGKRLYVSVDAGPVFVVVFRLPDNIVEDTIFTPDAYPYISSMTVAPDGSRLYAVDIGDQMGVCATRLSDFVIEWQVPDDDVSEGPGALAVRPEGSHLYVLEEELVSVRNSGSGFIVGAASLESPWSAEIDPDGSFLYVACAGEDGGAVAVVRTSDNKVVRVIAMPDEVYDVAPSPDGQKLYVTGENGKLYVLGR